ncbi:hypothetical protein [Flavobacterium sp.]|uniref:hypothetical protein n=1 Tax=Flavobacterium sp. TaxID=239 RepID=UPI0012135E13|nr:hypothetical protein [Flavobacterium sp.]RZJ71091.1 MAG: hypothetical protein EOO49_11600 [Flavobacterium sp.]
MCKIDLVDVGGEACEPIGGIFSEEVKISPFADFEDIKELPSLDVDGSVGSKATISGNHTFKAGKGFTKIIGITETGAFKATPLGETGRKMFQNELTVEVAGSEPELLGFLRMAKNLKFICIFTEAGSGRKRQIGSKRIPARFGNLEETIEALIEGKNGVTLTITDKGFCPAPVYTGTVTDKPVAST